MGLSSSPIMVRPDETVAADCLRRLRSRTSAGEFGYKIQAIAAHVLLGLKHRVVAVKPRGHPDIVSVRGGREFRFEIEAEVIGRKRRMLTPADFDALAGADANGYFALAVSFPRPHWIVVPVRGLVRRKSPAANSLLAVLSDRELSSMWTEEYVSLISRSCRDIQDRSFDQLVRRAVEGRGL